MALIAIAPIARTWTEEAGGIAGISGCYPEAKTERDGSAPIHDITEPVLQFFPSYVSDISPSSLPLSHC